MSRSTRRHAVAVAAFAAAVTTAVAACASSRAASDAGTTTTTESPSPTPSADGSAGAAVTVTSAPRSASALIARMRDRYADRWFRTLTFVQRTTVLRPGGVRDTSTWLEALQTPSRLRIDIGPLANRNGLIFTADSTYRIRDGAVAAATADANPLMPFVAALYLQPVERTMLELSREHYDTTRLRIDAWRGRPVAVVGTDRADDLTSAQFWIDLDRLVLVRLILPPPPQRPDAKPIDIHMNDYRPFGGGLVATRVDIIAGADTIQREEYGEVRANVPLDPALFEPATWGTAKHWRMR